jgi:hypothetical protein
MMTPPYASVGNLALLQETPISGRSPVIGVDGLLLSSYVTLFLHNTSV